MEMYIAKKVTAVLSLTVMSGCFYWWYLLQRRRRRSLRR